MVGSQDMETLLLSDKYLTRWIALSMAERVEKIRSRFGVRVSQSTLRLFYLRNSVKYRKTYQCYRGSITQKERLELERVNYATILDYLLVNEQ